MEQKEGSNRGNIPTQRNKKANFSSSLSNRSILKTVKIMTGPYRRQWWPRDRSFWCSRCSPPRKSSSQSPSIWQQRQSGGPRQSPRSSCPRPDLLCVRSGASRPAVEACRVEGGSGPRPELLSQPAASTAEPRNASSSLEIKIRICVYRLL